MLDGQLEVADRLATEALQIGTPMGSRTPRSSAVDSLFYIRWHQSRLKGRRVLARAGSPHSMDASVLAHP
jgi:hypothetical protein